MAKQKIFYECGFCKRLYDEESQEDALDFESVFGINLPIAGESVVLDIPLR